MNVKSQCSSLVGLSSLRYITSQQCFCICAPSSCAHQGLAWQSLPAVHGCVGVLGRPDIADAQVVMKGDWGSGRRLEVAWNEENLEDEARYPYYCHMVRSRRICSSFPNLSIVHLPISLPYRRRDDVQYLMPWLIRQSAYDPATLVVDAR